MLLGLGLAFGGIRHYTFAINSCHILPPPLVQSWFPSIFFVLVPLSIVMLGSTVFTVLVLLEVFRRERASARFSTRRYQWTRAVFWKSLLYLAAFYLTYPIMFSTFFVDVSSRVNWLFMLTSALAPSQGLWNFGVYFAYRKQSATRRGSKSTTSSRRGSHASLEIVASPTTSQARGEEAAKHVGSDDDGNVNIEYPNIVEGGEAEDEGNDVESNAPKRRGSAFENEPDPTVTTTA